MLFMNLTCLNFLCTVSLAVSKSSKLRYMKVFYVLIAIALYLLCACSKQNGYPESHPVIVFAIAQAPLNLDPRYATDAASERVNRLLYQPLVDFDAQSKPMPALAHWQKISPTQYRFILNEPHVRFHNGSELTTVDVAATYQSFMQLKNSPHAAEFANIDHINVINPKLLDFYLKTPDSQFVAKLIIGILPAALIANGHDFSHTPIGSGALKFISWQNTLLLERVADHQKISLIEVKDPTVRVLKLLHGEVDLLQGDLPPELVKHLQAQSEITVQSSVGANFSYLGLNMQDPVLKSLKVRQAIAHAIDRNAIVQKVMVMKTRAAFAILPPEHYTNAGVDSLKSYDYNPALSRQLLKEAGVHLPLHLIYKTSTDPQRVRFATIMQSQMQAAGIALEIRSLDWGTFFEDVKQGNFQLYGLTWVGIKTPEIYAKALGSKSFPPNGFNRGRYVDGELDSLLRKEDWPAAIARIHEQLPYIPLWYEGQFAAMRKGLHNYSPKSDGNWDDLARISNYAH
ncbi:glutathione-binding protein GsiB precursor [mine drainage metagenome]|uniref:Glutathione-binding protein GsiB n=1 Tax=mine drainage metagenome TaxID=410659 RepID=A0A1J5SEE5_9ZZZZ